MIMILGAQGVGPDPHVAHPTTAMESIGTGSGDILESVLTTGTTGKREDGRVEYIYISCDSSITLAFIFLPHSDGRDNRFLG